MFGTIQRKMNAPDKSAKTPNISSFRKSIS